jgi:hypothetical protein
MCGRDDSPRCDTKDFTQCRFPSPNGYHITAQKCDFVACERERLSEAGRCGEGLDYTNFRQKTRREPKSA